MSALLQRAGQTVTSTDLARHGRVMFDAIASGDEERLLVMREHKPIAVVLNVSVFESMLREIDVLRDQLFAQSRLNNTASRTISHDALVERFRA